MPLPFLILGGIALFSAIVGGAIYVVQINNIRGKRFTILGTRASGKTSLHKFLSEGELPKEYIASGEEKIEDNHFKLKHLNLRIKSSIDIGGNVVYEQRWKSLIEDGDYICYLIKIDKLYNDNDTEYRNKILRHINLILNHMNAENKQGPLYLIYTFCDFVEEFESNSDKFVEKFMKKNIDLFPENTASFFGSFKDNKGAESLCISLLGKISEKK